MPEKSAIKRLLKKQKMEYKKYRKAEDKKHISDFDREMKKLLKDEKNT